jgi:hypothetical protein
MNETRNKQAKNEERKGERNEDGRASVPYDFPYAWTTPAHSVIA